MSDTKRRCWVEINLGIIKENYNFFCGLLKPGQHIMAVVKADAYGHGDKETAKALSECGCGHFAVSNIQEALNIRQMVDYDAEILILGYTPPDFFNDLYKHNITQTILSEEYAGLLAANGKRIKCQFAIDSGMNRIGLDADFPEKCEGIIRRYMDKLDITGMFTHLCVADSFKEEDKVFTENQIKKLKAVSSLVKDLNLKEIHCLNTAGGLWHDVYGSTIRLGIAMYGLKPDYSNVLPNGIRPALSWKSVVSMVKRISRGETIGYGRTFRAQHDMVIATIPTGYADGYDRSLSNNGFVLIKGHKAPITGRVCMDQLMADVTSIPDVRMGDIVTLIGTDGNETISADDMAHIAGTIGYEIVCSISKRVEREFIIGA